MTYFFTNMIWVSSLQVDIPGVVIPLPLTCWFTLSVSTCIFLSMYRATSVRGLRGHTRYQASVPQWGGGGNSLKNEVWVCVALKNLFSCPFGCTQDPVSAFFSSQNPTFTLKSQMLRNFKLQSLKIGKEFHSKASNWAKILFIRLHFAQ